MAGTSLGMCRGEKLTCKMSSIGQSLISLVLVGGEGVQQFTNGLDKEEAHGGVEDTVKHLLVEAVGSTGASIEHKSGTNHLDSKESECQSTIDPHVYLRTLDIHAVGGLILVQIVPIVGPAQNQRCEIDPKF